MQQPIVMMKESLKMEGIKSTHLSPNNLGTQLDYRRSIQSDPYVSLDKMNYFEPVICICVVAGNTKIHLMINYSQFPKHPFESIMFLPCRISAV